MLVNNDSTSRLAIKRELSYFVISLAKLKESLTVNSLWVKDSKIGIKNFARLYPGVLIAERIGLYLPNNMPKFSQFFLLLTLLDIILENFWYLF